MSKRSAEVQITADNYELDGDPEEAGQFETASEDQLQQRVIKKARRGRTMVDLANTQKEGGGIFAGIKFSATTNGPPTTSTTSTSGFPLLSVSSSGFSLLPATTSSSSGFSLLPSFSFASTSSSTASPFSLPPLTVHTKPASPPTFPSKPLTSSLVPPSTSKPPPPALSGPPPSSSSLSSATEPESEYLQQLQSLNVSVRDWIDKHVSENPYVDLTPIFRDYETHLNTIDAKYHPSSASVASSTVSPQTTTDGETTQSSEEGEEDITVMAGSSSSGQPPQGATIAAAPSLDRPAPPEVPPLAPSPSSDSQPPQSVTASSGPSSNGQAKPEADTDALHSVRAKLYYKKDSGFTELGIGTLRVIGGGTTGVQLLLRNDTSLGNILLNVRLTAGVPLNTKSNNVFLVCPPNPPLDKKEAEGEAKAVTYLIRVKTAAMADELVARIQDNLK